MLGGQSSLEVGFGVAVVATIFGMTWGAIAGFTGGILDSLMMRIVDALLAIPLLFFIVLLASLIRPNLIADLPRDRRRQLDGDGAPGPRRGPRPART